MNHRTRCTDAGHSHGKCKLSVHCVSHPEAHRTSKSAPALCLCALVTIHTTSVTLKAQYNAHTELNENKSKVCSGAVNSGSAELTM